MAFDDEESTGYIQAKLGYPGHSSAASNAREKAAAKASVVRMGGTKQARTQTDYRRDGGTLMIEEGTTPLAYLEDVMNGNRQPTTHQMQAAVAILPYRHRKQPVAVENSGPNGAAVPLSLTVSFVKPNP